MRSERGNKSQNGQEGVSVNYAVQDGKLLYESGRTKEAEAALRQAIRTDPENKAAHYYLDLAEAQEYTKQAGLREVNSKRMLMEVEKERVEPARKPQIIGQGGARRRHWKPVRFRWTRRPLNQDCKTWPPPTLANRSAAA